MYTSRKHIYYFFITWHNKHVIILYERSCLLWKNNKTLNVNSTRKANVM